LIKQKAISISFKQAIPNAYWIDEDYCLFHTKGVCQICEKVCPFGAIDFTQEEETVNLNVGAIIACTGYSSIDPKSFGQYSFGL
ncbi:disulfide reductase, partial [Candidatus Bathyarchaeota archaeon]|nr:disulfide reductase [Candidatus Bathyarchaeota archaeon]NIR15730.1 disulfide reductase [Desulfobacterales bacterium]NIU81119.1 disulfide reductase [Candidatus Bathyarchaeota archaeon]NIV68470.1 disulfide reductase [Candidatus Bathyarchaeota archaeon]NIW34197.1 disulfide reductase [Candidatus Bathyarchaeota archaeon]